MTEPRSPRLPATAPADGRTALGRALEARDFTYDLSRDREEPPAVTAARERHRAITARIEAACAALPAARERRQAALDAAAEPPPVTAASRCGRCGYLTGAAGHRVMCGE